MLHGTPAGGARLTGSPASATPILHATLIAAHRGGGWRGALLEGASGVGKSDLALRALRSGWRLAADDRVLVWTSGGRLFGRAPRTLHGLVEARGLGVVAGATIAHAEIVLAVSCEGALVEPERVPAPERRELFGLAVPLIRLQAREASALAKLELALTGAPFDSGAERRI